MIIRFFNTLENAKRLRWTNLDPGCMYLSLFECGDVHISCDESTSRTTRDVLTENNLANSDTF